MVMDKLPAQLSVPYKYHVILVIIKFWLNVIKLYFSGTPSWKLGKTYLTINANMFIHRGFSCSDLDDLENLLS